MVWIFFFFFFFTLKDFFFFSSLYHFDSSSMFMLSICPLVAFLIFSNSFMYFGSHFKISYSSLFSVVIAMVSLCFVASGMLYFLFLVELTVIPMCSLLFIFSKDKDKISSTSFMMLINILGSIPFMINASFFIDNNTLFTKLIYCSTTSALLFFCFLLILCCKLPLFLSHFWLTKAHVSGSGACSMLLASLMLKMGSYGMLKFMPFFIKMSNSMVGGFLSFSLLGLMAFCMFMIRFLDIKVLIASSSIVHMGLILPLSMHFGSEGVLGSMFMMTSHGLCSYILFYLISLIYEVSHSRSMDFNKSLESTFKFMSMLLFIFMFINLGVPPMISFLSEVYFCLFFYKTTFFSLFIFSTFMVVSIIFTMFLISKFLFGKKNFSGGGSASMSGLGHTSFYVLFLLLLPFIY